MNINDAFPSNYLKASDLKGRSVAVVIDSISMEEIGKGENKMICYFAGKDKGMVLNKTNANNIAVLYGPETDNWIGKEVILFEAMVDFQGRTVPALRVRGPQPKDQPRQQEQIAHPPKPRRNIDEMQDGQDVPF